jgi:hypothetical protein
VKSDLCPDLKTDLAQFPDLQDRTSRQDSSGFIPLRHLNPGIFIGTLNNQAPHYPMIVFRRWRREKSEGLAITDS